MIEQFYEEELRYLYESGKRFAEAHPDRAPYLNIDSVGDRDPYVERLFEGFAFLTARVREKIEDSFPELTEGLLQLLWPHLLQSLPSVVMMQFTHRRGLLQNTLTVGRHTQINGIAAGPNNTQCSFQTSSAVDIHPLSLADATIDTDTRGQSHLHLHFAVDPQVPWSAIALSHLPIYLHAEQPTVLALHHFLTGKVKSVALDIDGQHCPVSNSIEAAVRPGGFETPLLPQDPRAMGSFQTLLEYFLFQEKYHFVNLHGWDLVGQLSQEPKKIIYTITFQEPFPPRFPFTKDAFRLYCTPAINLFDKDAEPLHYSGTETEYHLRADSRRPDDYQIHSLKSVTGIDRLNGKRYEYKPYYEFGSHRNKAVRSYSSQYRLGPTGKRDVYISIIGSGLTEGEIREESISAATWCSNGMIPRSNYAEGDISKPGPGFPEVIQAKNIIRPTLPIDPPADRDYIWTFLSHMSTGYAGFSDADRLSSFLQLYNWTAAEGKKRRVNAIEAVEVRNSSRVYRGSLLNGVVFSITVAESGFESDADMHLFGIVLHRFLSGFISINTFCDMEFVLQPSHRVIRFDGLVGVRWHI